MATILKWKAPVSEIKKEKITKADNSIDIKT
jgi:hypothetical protein